MSSYIPGGCTSFVQVLDVSLNKPLKALVAQAAEDHADKYASRYEEGAFTVADRRVLLTEWVGRAWTQLHTEYKQTIIDTFRHVGLSLHPNGSEDHEIKIKDLDNIAVGDYARGKVDRADGLGSLTPVDIMAIAAAKVKLALRRQTDHAYIDKCCNKDLNLCCTCWPPGALPLTAGFLNFCILICVRCNRLEVCLS